MVLLPTNNLALSLIAVLSIMLMTACAPNGQSPESVQTQTDGTADSKWSVILNISGGIAGQMRQISVDETGRAVLVNKKTKSQIEKQVTPQDLQNIARLVKLLPVKTAPDQRSSQCRDCISYQLVATVDGTNQQRATDSLNLHDSDVNELIQAMSTLASGMKNRE